MRARLAGLAIAALAAATPSTAATLTQSLATTGSFAIIPFDPGLGTLQSVTLSYTGSSSFLIPTTTPSPPGAGYSLSNFFSIYVGPLYFDATATGSGTVGTNNGSITLTSIVSPADTDTRTDSFALAVFSTPGLSGSITYDLPYILSVDGTGLDPFAMSKAGATANVDITYTYSTAPGAVPEPATWAMMIAGMGLAGGIARHGHRRAGSRA